jgi:hypothetical protein
MGHSSHRLTARYDWNVVTYFCKGIHREHVYVVLSFRAWAGNLFLDVIKQIYDPDLRSHTGTPRSMCVWVSNRDLIVSHSGAADTPHLPTHVTDRYL